MIGEFGVVAGAEEVPWRHGLATFLAFLVAGALPLFPYVFLKPNHSDFLISVVATGMTLFLVGALRTLFTRRGWLRSGLEMLVVGAIAAACAYGVGAALAAII